MFFDLGDRLKVSAIAPGSLLVESRRSAARARGGRGC